MKTIGVYPVRIAIPRDIKRIALIRPGRYPEGFIVPLGLLYLAGYLNLKAPDIEITVIDNALEDLGLATIAQRVKMFNPELVGLTGLTTHTVAIQETARYIRATSKETIIIAGGPCVSSNYEEVLKERSIDFGVIGEGEETLYRVVKALREGRELLSLEGLVYLDRAGRIVVNGQRQPILDLDELPLPAYHLLSVENYFNSPRRNSQSPIYISKRNLPVLTSRGCPFQCIYCHNTFGKSFRARKPGSVVGEIIWLKGAYNIEELEIIDDIFNFDKERAKDIMRRLIAADLNLKISFSNGIKYEMLDDELLQLFKEAGVFRLAFGIESGNKRIQRILQKEVDLVRMRKIIERASALGFFVSGFFQLGLPGETRQEMLDTISYASSTRLHTATFHLTTPFPGTQMYNEHIKGRFKFPYSASIRRISVNVSAVGNRELIWLKRLAYFRFYFNLRRISGIYKRFPVKKRILLNFINLLSDIFFGRWPIET